MAWGFNPYLMEADQFAGAYLSVVESIAKLVAAGFEHKRAYLSDVYKRQTICSPRSTAP